MKGIGAMGDRSDERLPRLTLSPDRPPRQPSDTRWGHEFGSRSPRNPPSERTDPAGPAEVPAIRSSRAPEARSGGRGGAYQPGQHPLRHRAALHHMAQLHLRAAAGAMPAANLEHSPNQLGPGGTRPPPLALRLLGQGPQLDARWPRRLFRFRDDLPTQSCVPRQYAAVDDLVRPCRRHDRHEAGHELFRREPQCRSPVGVAAS